MQGHRFQPSARPQPWEIALEQARVRAGLAPEIYWHGETSLLASAPRIAFAGTREAEAWTLAAIEGLAGLIVGEGGIVISGGALGTDTAAHRGALQSGGGTIVVLPVPIETIDPARWRRPVVSGWDLGRTLFLSPFPRGTHTRPSHPIVRNRLIAALGQVAVVGQTRPRSGTNHFLARARAHRRPRFLLDAPGGDEQVETALRSMETEGAVLFDEKQAYSRDFARTIIQRAREHSEREDGAEQLHIFGAGDSPGDEAQQ